MQKAGGSYEPPAFVCLVSYASTVMPMTVATNRLTTVSSIRVGTTHFGVVSFFWKPYAIAKIAVMPKPDRAMAGRLHAIIKASAPALSPRLWYGMPAYYKDGKVVCFFQSAQKFKTRYATFGFMHEANLDEGAMWPTAFALKELTAAEEARIGALVKKAVS